MKKTVLIVAFAMALLLALAAPAFAKYAGYNSSKQYVPWAEAQSLASQNPDAALMSFGPHKGYATTTIKCAVCHSVHRAGNKLLNEGAACAFCHTSVANGGGAVATAQISWATLNSGPHGSRCTNDDCHGGPHGVGASVYAGPASKLLTAKADTQLDALVTANTAAGATIDLAVYNQNTAALATAAVCSRSGCHVDSMFGVVAAGAKTTLTEGVPKAVTGHRVVAAATSTWNADASMGSSKTNITIAYKPVDGCASCHDLTDDNNGGLAAFPHGITDVVSVDQGKVAGTRAAIWLTAAPDSATQSLAVGPYNQYSVNGSAETTVAGAAGSTIIDGTCLKCHKSATEGIGISY